jgi:predicted RNase H-like HicB family nuclease
MRQFTYAVKLTLDKADGGYVVTSRDLPEAITQGESIREALTEAADCLEEAIAARLSKVVAFQARSDASGTSMRSGDPGRRQLLQHVAALAGGVAVC